MIRTILTPENQNISIQIPENFVGKNVEVIVFTVDKAFSGEVIADLSLTLFATEAVLSKDWLTPEEDLVWQDL